MAKTIFEQTGCTYTQVGNYLLPCLKLPEEQQAVGIWGQHHAKYLKQNHKVLYYNLLTSGRLNSYLADVDQRAGDMFFRLVKELAEKENATEELKARDQMLWVKRMNIIRDSATETVNSELIFI